MSSANGRQLMVHHHKFLVSLSYGEKFMATADLRGLTNLVIGKNICWFQAKLIEQYNLRTPIEIKRDLNTLQRGMTYTLKVSWTHPFRGL